VKVETLKIAEGGSKDDEDENEEEEDEEEESTRILTVDELEALFLLHAPDTIGLHTPVSFIYNTNSL
jgi:hypothetical protein